MRKLKLIFLALLMVAPFGLTARGVPANSGFEPLCLALVSPQNTSNYMAQGGARWVIRGSLDIASGGEIDIESGGAWKIAGTAVTVSAAELNYLDGLTAGTVTASKFVLVDANKDIGDFRNLDAVNFDAGASGTAGTVDIFPSTASKGKFTLSITNQTGDTTVTLNADAMGQASTFHLADPGAAAAYMVTSTAALTLAEVDVLDAVSAGTVAANKAVVVDGSKNIGDFGNLTAGNLYAATEISTTSGATVLTDGDVTIGLPDMVAGTTGTLTLKPSTISTGSMIFTPAANSGDYDITITNAAHGQTTTYTLPDAGAATANLVASTNALSLAEVDVLDGVTAGTVTASKALVVDASRDLATIHNLTGDGLLSVQAELSGGANVSHLIKKTNLAGETYSGTEAGLTIKAYDEDATVVHGAGENAALAVFFKPQSDSGTGGENVIATFHKYAGAAGTVKHGVVIYGDMTNGLAISGGTSDYCLNFENQTASVADIKASTGNTMGWGSAAPASGTWTQGDIVWNTGAAAGGKVGWVCTTGGTPGTWKAFGVIDS